MPWLTNCLHIRHKIIQFTYIYIYVLHPDHNWVSDHFSLYQWHT